MVQRPLNRILHLETSEVNLLVHNTSDFLAAESTMRPLHKCDCLPVHFHLEAEETWSSFSTSHLCKRNNSGDTWRALETPVHGSKLIFLSSFRWYNYILVFHSPSEVEWQVLWTLTSWFIFTMEPFHLVCKTASISRSSRIVRKRSKESPGARVKTDCDTRERRRKYYNTYYFILQTG